jgi:protein-S-isoprenylcysteine O-methyltransferase Ste14
VRTAEILIVGGWALFWIYWLVAALPIKRGRVSWSRELGIRAVLFVVIVVLVRLGAFSDRRIQANPWLAIFGLTLLAVGLGFAVRARRHLGRDWGPPMTRRDHPDLVTSGPYRLVRHPIYSGILLAGIGTAVALNGKWLTAVAVAGVYFVYSAVVEERQLAEALPDSYREYRKSSKMLVPFLF